MQEQEQLQQEQQQKPVPPKKKKKDNPLGIIIVVCISVLAVSMFPIWFVKYSDGATRLITPVTTWVFTKTEEVVMDNGEYRVYKPDVDVYFIPNNFKSYEELLQIKQQRQAQQQPQE